MTEKTYVVRFKDPQLGIQPVIAASAEIHGEHIALLNSKGKLAALLLTEVIESLFELPLRSAAWLPRSPRSQVIASSN